MPYIGYNVTNAGSFAIIDDISGTFNGSNTSFTLNVGGVNITPNTANLLIAIDGVVQQAPDAYTVTGSTINFTGAPASGADFYGVLMGQSSYVENNSIGADELNISGNGTSGQVLQSDGDGTFSYLSQSSITAPAGSLTGNTLASGVTASSLTSVGTLTGLTVSGDVNFDSNTLSIDALNNRVGIGTASPTNALLEVKTDDENIARFDGLQGNIDFRYGSDIEFDRAGQVYITANNASGELNFRTGGQNIRMHIDSSGNVGIGQSAPKSLLQIDGENAAGVLTISHGGASNSISDNEILGTIDFSGYDLTNTYAIGAKIQARANGNWADASTNYAGTDLEFYTQDDTTTDRFESLGTPTPRMVINKSGNVGINTNNPASQMSAGTVLEVKDSSIASLALQGAGSSRWELTSDNGDDFKVSRNGSTAITVDGSNNRVGIGLTNPSSALQVVGAFSSQIKFGTNTSVYTNMSMGTGFTVFDSIGGDSGAFDFRDDGTSRMFIDSSGDVGIGTTSPDRRLHVQDNPASQVAVFKNTGGAFNSDGVLIHCGKNTPVSAGDARYLTFYDGDGTASGGVRNSSTVTTPEFFGGSDERIKENISDSEIQGISTINQIRLRQFNFKNRSASEKVKVGIVAQEVESVLPEMVADMGIDGWEEYLDDSVDSIKGVSEQPLVLYLVKAVQELTARIEALENA